MEGLDVWPELARLGLVFVLMGVAIWWLNDNRKEMKSEFASLIRDKDKEISDYSRDYKELANKSISVLILVEDKLKNDAHSSKTIEDIHRIVQDILVIEQRRS